MLSKNKIKFIKSLQQKKFRNEQNLFVVEGRKGVLSLINSSFKVTDVYCSQNILLNYSDLGKLNPTVCEESAIEKATGLKSNKEVIAIAEQLLPVTIDWQKEILYLDGVSDPGNLGTIIRTVEWFGINQIVCSDDCVEFYNPKVIQSTMGAFVNKIPIVKSVNEFLREKPKDVKVYLTAFDGVEPSKISGIKSGILVMGSESHGISSEWEAIETEKITIPSASDTKAESLNVAVATSILCYQIKQD